MILTRVLPALAALLACGLAAGAAEESASRPPLPRFDRPAPPRILLRVLAPPAGNAKRRAAFRNLFLDGGAPCEAIREQPVPGAGESERNVLIHLPGANPDAPAIVIAAHLDAIGEGSGAVDNWSGAVMLAALYRRFRDARLAHPVVFAGFAGEESGQKGSRRFVRETDPRAVLCMVNLECLGVGRVRTWRNRSADALERLALRAGLGAGVLVRRESLFEYCSDALAFSRAGIPSVTIHSLAPADFAWINGPGDTPARIRMPRYREAFRFLDAFLRLLDRTQGALPDADAEREERPVPRTLYACAADRGTHVRLLRLPFWSAERRAGLRPGDTLAAVDDTPIHSREDLLHVLRTLSRGDAVTLRLRRLREGRPVTLGLSLRY